MYMRLFRRKQAESRMHPCPRCSQLVDDDQGSICPMCGWDLHEAYQGPTRVQCRDTRDAPAEGEDRFRHESRDSLT
jgi:hypothetical protein